MKHDSLIDRLVAEYNAKPPPRNPRGRKGNNRLRTEQKLPSPDLPAMVDQGTRAWKVAQMLKEGHSIHDIAERYGIRDQDIGVLLEQALLKLYEAAAPIVFNWMMLSLTRTEDMLRTLYPHLEDPSGYPDLKVMRAVQSLMTQQSEILAFATPKAKEEDSSFILTMTEDSKLYPLAVRALEQEFRTGTFERDPEVVAMDNPFGSAATPFHD